MVTTELQAQKKWYTYYRNNPDHLSSMGLFHHAVANEILDDFTKHHIIFMLNAVEGYDRADTRKYITRQYDIAMEEYLENGESKSPASYLPELQSIVDSIKEKIWCYGDRQSKLFALSDLVIQCYKIAQSVGGNLDDCISKKISTYDSIEFDTTISEVVS